MTCSACAGEVHSWGYSDGFDYCRVCGEGLPPEPPPPAPPEHPLLRATRLARGDLTGDELTRLLLNLRNPNPSVQVTVTRIDDSVFEIRTERL